MEPDKPESNCSSVLRITIHINKKMEIFELGTEKINVCGGNSEGIVVLVIYHILFIFYLLICI